MGGTERVVRRRVATADGAAPTRQRVRRRIATADLTGAARVDGAAALPPAARLASTGRVQRSAAGPEPTTAPAAPRLERAQVIHRSPAADIAPTGDPLVIRRAGIWDWFWGGTKTVGEGMDTTSAGLETVDETHKVMSGSQVLTGGLKTGSDTLGSVGGLIGGTKDLSEGMSSTMEEGLGVNSGMKMSGGVTGLLGGMNKGVSALLGEGADDFLKKWIGWGGEDIGSWLDFLGGSTKVISGGFTMSKSYGHYNRAKTLSTTAKSPGVKQAAATMMDIINETWWSGFWEAGFGSLDVAASFTIEGYTHLMKGVGLTSKLGGGDLLWSLLQAVSPRMPRTNDQIQEQVQQRKDDLIKDVDTMTRSALDKDDDDALVEIYNLAGITMPEFAEAISKSVKQLPRKDYGAKKQRVKGKVWS